MNYSSITYLLAGFSFLCVALISSSQFIKRLRFSSFINLHRIHDAAPRYRVLVQVICYSLAVFLIAKAIWMTIAINRDTLWTLAGLGGVLVLVRIFAVTFGDISILGFELELEREKAKKIRLLRSPLILGGAILILLFGAVPFLTDFFMLKGVKEHQWSQHVRELAAANKNHFKEKYIERNIFAETQGQIPGQTLTEDVFFHNLTDQNGQRFIITGKAGVGKSWFLRQLSLKVREISPKKVILNYSAGDLASAGSVEQYINNDLFGAASWYTMPLTRKVIGNSLILFDGFDEVEFGKRKRFAEQLEDLAQEYPDSSILVTTRPGALEKIPNYTKVSLEEFSVMQYELYIKPSRIKGLKKRLDEALEKGFNLDLHVLRLLGFEKTLSEKELGEGDVQKCFDNFLIRYKFNVIADGQQYAFMSTYRDMEILEELFVDLLTGGIRSETALIRAGRKSICEQFLLQRMIRNSQVKGDRAAIAKEAIEVLTEIAGLEYRRNPALVKFVFDRKTLRRNFYNEVFDNFALRSELLEERTQGEKCQYVFENITIDSYFISRVLFKSIKKDPSKTEETLARYHYYEDSDILPFLIAQFDRVEDIFRKYLMSLSRTFGTGSELSTHLKQRLTDILLYVDRSEVNLQYLKNLPQSKEVLALPEHAQQEVMKAVSIYCEVCG